ncbi:hypothetical protein [Paenibacillus oryzae]|uniref:hypothetical protein n=1 Tax=Paenibacillus oryzae TaxID=1844972 RepID=UPI0012E9DE9D|nr:hypothetical protein [Paenibacillus oryzae]
MKFVSYRKRPKSFFRQNEQPRSSCHHKRQPAPTAALSHFCHSSHCPVTQQKQQAGRKQLGESPQ